MWPRHPFSKSSSGDWMRVRRGAPSTTFKMKLMAPVFSPHFPHRSLLCALSFLLERWPQALKY